MNAVTTVDNTTQSNIKRRGSFGDSPAVLSNIYQNDINIAVWQRNVVNPLRDAADYVIKTKPVLQFSATVTPKDASSIVARALGSTDMTTALNDDIAELVDMYCFLFDVDSVGLRLVTLDRAMCSRFHVDWVPCRLVTTYVGIATEWLAHQDVDRSKLGMGNEGKSDAQSGLMKTMEDIQSLAHGEVALMKGEGWVGNEGAGLVHRSPPMEAGTQRLLLTLDSVGE